MEGGGRDVYREEEGMGGGSIEKRKGRREYKGEEVEGSRGERRKSEGKVG